MAPGRSVLWLFRREVTRNPARRLAVHGLRAIGQQRTIFCLPSDCHVSLGVVQPTVQHMAYRGGWA